MVYATPNLLRTGDFDEALAAQTITVLASNNTPYVVGLTVLNSANTPFVISKTVLASNNTPYNV